MAWSVVGSVVSVIGIYDDVSLPAWPAGTTTGDMVIVTIAFRNALFTAPAGWTQIGPTIIGGGGPAPYGGASMQQWVCYVGASLPDATWTRTTGGGDTTALSCRTFRSSIGPITPASLLHNDAQKAAAVTQNNALFAFGTNFMMPGPGHNCLWYMAAAAGNAGTFSGWYANAMSGPWVSHGLTGSTAGEDITLGSGHHLVNNNSQPLTVYGAKDTIGALVTAGLMVFEEPLTSKPWVNHGGVWKYPTTWVKAAGAWKQVARTWVKHDGRWK